MFSYVVYILVLTLECAESHSKQKGSMKIESFTINGVELTNDDVPRPTVSVAVNATVTLVCTASPDTHGSIVSISKLDDEKLNQTLHSRTLSYTIDHVQCDDMGSYFCQVRSYSVAYVGLDLAVKNCAPKVCTDSERNITQGVKLGQRAVFSICVISHAKESPRIEVNGVQFHNGIPNGSIMIDLDHISESSLVRMLRFEVRVLTNEEYGVYDLSLQHGTNDSLHVYMNVQPEENTTRVHFSSNMSSNGHVLLTCSTAKPIKYLAIWRGNTEKMKTYGDGISTGAIKDLVLDSSSCSEMGNYRCVVTDQLDETTHKLLNVQVEKCKFSLCRGEPYRQTIYTKLGDDALSSVCLRTTDGFQKLAEINDVSYTINDLSGDTNFNLWIFPKSPKSDKQFHLMIYIQNVSESDFRNHTIKLKSLTYQELVIKLEIIAFTKGVNNYFLNFKRKLTLAVTFPIVITVIVALILGAVYGFCQISKVRRNTARIWRNNQSTVSLNRKNATESVVCWGKHKRGTLYGGGNYIDNDNYQPESVLSVLSGQEMYELAMSQLNTRMDTEDETKPLVDFGDLQQSTSRMVVGANLFDVSTGSVGLNQTDVLEQHASQLVNGDEDVDVKGNDDYRGVELRERIETEDGDDSSVHYMHKSMFVPETEALLPAQRKSMSFLEKRRFRF